MAARALGQIGSDTAVPDLLKAAWLVDTRYEAILALAAIQDTRATPVFIDALSGSEDIETVQAAEFSLVKLGDDAINEMIETFLITNPECPETIKSIRICKLLGNSHNATALATLKKILDQEKDPEVKSCIKQQLSNNSLSDQEKKK